MNDTRVIEAIHYETNKPIKVEIIDGLISEINEISGSSVNPGLYVAPGLIDNQINGYNGVDFSDPGLTTRKMKSAVEAILRDGVTSFIPTIITGSHEILLKCFTNLAEAIKDEDIRYSVPGFHLEGPYISPEEGFYGCHPAEFIRNPSWQEFEQYQEAAGGNIRLVTLSPEIEGSIQFIDMCVRHNVIVAVGHTNASAEQINRAVRHGARLSTHLGNGCANLIDRHRNPLWPQLANDLLTPSIIADGHHLLPEEIQVFYKVKGPHNIILTSDVTHLIGMSPGRYIFLGSEVVLTDEGLIENPVLNCLAGASMPLKTGVGNVMRFTGCTLGEAVNMASGNITRIYNLTDRGSLTPGKRADLILFEMDGSSPIIKQVIVNGRIVLPQTSYPTPHTL
jgi:N-acetylglucosamine-6-phosphate deacetylase